jgi:gluconate kinase
MTTITILYGEMGSGKNYQGERLAKKIGAPFLDGDTVLPPTMLERVKAFQPLTEGMLCEFIHLHLYSAILDAVERAKDDPPTALVVAQALYRQENRTLLCQQLRRLGHDVEFVHVRAPFLQNLRQLWSRPRGLRWVFYWLLNKAFFQS